jgi:hypothetical protein
METLAQQKPIFYKETLVSRVWWNTKFWDLKETWIDVTIHGRIQTVKYLDLKNTKP